MKYTSLALLTLLPFSLFAASGEIDMHGGKQAKLTPTMPTHKAKIFYASILESNPLWATNTSKSMKMELYGGLLLAMHLSKWEKR